MSDAARRRWYEQAIPSALVVVIALLGISFLNDDGGYLGTDTGGKVATLEAMVQRGDWSPDVGYWAEEADPSGAYHPMYGTSPTDAGWVQVTSLPMIYAARPLYELGGYRVALLLPILGTVAAALAGRRIAGRLGSPADGTRAFWVLAAGSPLVIYGLDLWEHSLGVAAAAWAVVLALEAVDGDGRWYRSVGAGALLAFGATMRTEILVYTLTIVGAAVLATIFRKGFVPAVRTGALAVVGFAPVWLANAMLEEAVGGQSRVSRATGTATAATDGGGESQYGERLSEGLQTTFAAYADGTASAAVVGVGITLAITLAVRFSHRLDHERRRMLAAVLLLIPVVVVSAGLGFVPGLFLAFPVAAAALALHRRSPPALALIAVALVSLPVVWAFQFLGGAGPQWGGRYVLVSSFLLGVVGVLALGDVRTPSAVRRSVFAVSVAVTVLGLAWLWERSHEIDGLFDQVVALEDGVVIARNQFFLREAGPTALDRRWLSVPRSGDLDGPIDVIESFGIERFSVLQDERYGVIDRPGVELVGSERIAALGSTFELISYRFDP